MREELSRCSFARETASAPHGKMKDVSPPVGIYVSVPFCRAKCTFCNFASEAFPPSRMQEYVNRLLREIETLPDLADKLQFELPKRADSIYLGGGTPSLLEASQLRALLESLQERWEVDADAEITMEAAPGQVSEPLLHAALRAGVNRISLGVQSFVDGESRAVGRLHTAEMCRAEITKLQAAGVPRLSVDLIAGLPFQTAQSWQESLQQVIDSGVEHVSVYMLETDGESRLGTEVERVRATSQLTVLGQQARYHASAVPSDDLCADLYLQACETLAANGLRQYEISNFARNGAESSHNRKYWERAPYVGLGLDAHSMLLAPHAEAVRFQNGDELEGYLAASSPRDILHLTAEQAFEEVVFLGLRLVDGLPLERLASFCLPTLRSAMLLRARDLATCGLLTMSESHLALTARGRVLSSAVFGELLTATV